MEIWRREREGEREYGKIEQERKFKKPMRLRRNLNCFRNRVSVVCDGGLFCNEMSLENLQFSVNSITFAQNELKKNLPLLMNVQSAISANLLRNFVSPPFRDAKSATLQTIVAVISNIEAQESATMCINSFHLSKLHYVSL